MSEYSASAPVAARNTLPRIMMPDLLYGLMSTRMAYSGLKALSTTGLVMIRLAPVIPRNENQITIAGPKARPILLVPARCTENRAVMMISTRITTFACPAPRTRSKKGMDRRPSTAEVTVTAGVSTPSASSAAPPIMAGNTSHFQVLRTSE